MIKYKMKHGNDEENKLEEIHVQQTEWIQTKASN